MALIADDREIQWLSTIVPNVSAESSAPVADHATGRGKA
jgi:hypothetical protein